jgi:hypothetical protein
MAYRKTAGCVLLLVGMLTATACGGDSDGKGAQGPSSKQSALKTAPPPETNDPLELDPGSKAGLPGARAALKAFLQGQAKGESLVCRYVAKDGDFVNGPALRGNCTKGVKDTPHFLRPKERQALGQILVNGGKINKSGDAVLPFSGLSWTEGHLTERTLQSEFVLRRNAEGMWQIIR